MGVTPKSATLGLGTQHSVAQPQLDLPKDHTADLKSQSAWPVLGHMPVLGLTAQEAAKELWCMSWRVPTFF